MAKKAKEKGGYRAKEFKNAVIADFTGKRGAAHILEVICAISQFDKPEATFTKKQLAERARCCSDTVRTHLRELRRLGVIVPLKGYSGGQGVATTYRLHAIGEAGRAYHANEGAGGKPKSITQRIVEIMNVEGCDWGTAKNMALKEGFTDD